MSDATASAHRALRELRHAPLAQSSPLILAAAAMDVEKDRRGSGFETAAACIDPEMAFFVAVAAATVRPDDAARQRIARFASSLPAESLHGLLIECEPLLARLGGAWAWQMARDLLGKGNHSPSLFGLFIARTDDTIDSELY